MRATTRLLTATVALAALVPAPARAANGAWTPTLAATSAFDNLSAFRDGTAYATVGLVTHGMSGIVPSPVPAPSTDSTGFFKSTDFGRTWVPMAPPPATPRSGGGTSNIYLRFASPHIGYATFDGATDLPPDPTGRVSRSLCLQVSTTYRTTDGGKTWTPLCEPHLANGTALGPGESPLAVGPDGNTVLVTGSIDLHRTVEDCTAPSGAVAFSTNAGSSWQITTLPAPYYPGWTVRAFDRKTALVIAYREDFQSDCSASGDANAVFLTTDSGRTYRKVLDCAKQPLCTSAAFVTRTRILVGRTDGSTMSTDDGGRTWRNGQRLADEVNDRAAAASGNPDEQWWHWVQGFGFSDSRHGYASTRGGGTWRTDDGGRSWTQERSHECVYYPYGVGENVSSNAETSITGGPGVFSARQQTPTPAGPCHPGTANVAPPAVPPDAVAVSLPGLTLGLDGRLTLTPR